MPGRDGTGPIGTGPQNGRGFGRGFGRGYAMNCKSFVTPEAQKELLKNQRDVLKNRLEAIDKQLKNL